MVGSRFPGPLGGQGEFDEIAALLRRTALQFGDEVLQGIQVQKACPHAFLQSTGAVSALAAHGAVPQARSETQPVLELARKSGEFP